MIRIYLSLLLGLWVCYEPCSAEKEVLLRDRLVFLLCDQMKEYMTSGVFPEPVKKMPEKYKKIKPGSHFKTSAPGRGFEIDAKNRTKKKNNKGTNKGRTMNMKNVEENRIKREALLFPGENEEEYATLLDLMDEHED